MTNVASLLLADGVVTITPAEPASLELALIGFGMLAAFAIFGGWRAKRRTLAMTVDKDEAQSTTTERQAPVRRAA